MSEPYDKQEKDKSYPTGILNQTPVRREENDMSFDCRETTC